MTLTLLAILIGLNLLMTGWQLWQQQQAQTQQQQRLEQILQQLTTTQQLYETLTRLLNEQQAAQQAQRESFDKHQIESLKTLQQSMQGHMQELRQQLTTTLTSHMQTVDKQMLGLRERVDKQLTEIANQVEKRLSSGFDKTTAIFQDVIKRLAMIDQAQKRISELSGNVVNLQQILTDKRSRGAFGEVQLSALLSNVMPDNSYQLQHTLSNGKRVDCLLMLPEPTGNIAIDSKFPLETFQLLQNQPASSPDKSLQQQFRQDIRKHIIDIAEKYIIADETSDGAIMFLPAEAIFAEIHAYYPELVALAHQHKVWLASPTTMMAILTTASAVLKDVATRKQVHIIQAHLGKLGEDFGRFQTRMDNLARHIRQANNDVEQVHLSSQKISSRFQKIEQVELQPDELKLDKVNPHTEEA